MKFSISFFLSFPVFFLWALATRREEKRREEGERKAEAANRNVLPRAGGGGTTVAGAGGPEREVKHKLAARRPKLQPKLEQEQKEQNLQTKSNLSHIKLKSTSGEQSSKRNHKEANCSQKKLQNYIYYILYIYLSKSECARETETERGREGAREAEQENEVQ